MESAFHFVMRINVRLAITIVAPSDVSISAKASHARELLQQVRLKVAKLYYLRLKFNLKSFYDCNFDNKDDYSYSTADYDAINKNKHN